MVLASDVADGRDGMGLELYDQAENLLAVIYRDDISRRTTFISQQSFSIPIEVLRGFLNRAGEVL